jgi:hypothetical protein
MTGEDDATPETDPERAAALRTIADDVRGDSSESRQVAAILYRVSDLYDPDESTTPEHVYRNMRTILRVTERGTLARDLDDEGDGDGDGTGEGTDPSSGGASGPTEADPS